MSSAQFAQFSHFQQSGYLIVDGCVPPSLLDRVESVVWRDIEDRVLPYRSANGAITRLDQLWDRDAVFREVIEHPILLDALEVILGPHIEFLIRRHNHVTLNGPSHQVAGRGGDGLHRDSLQWSQPIVTVLVYLDESTVQNGATILIPGSHVLPFAGMPPDGGGGSHLRDHDEYQPYANQGLACEMPRGGILLFNSLLFHSVGRNRSGTERMSMTFGYRSVDELQPTPRGYARVVRGEAIYRGNDADVRRKRWQGDVFVTEADAAE